MNIRWPTFQKNISRSWFKNRIVFRVLWCQLCYYSLCKLKLYNTYRELYIIKPGNTNEIILMMRFSSLFPWAMHFRASEEVLILHVRMRATRMAFAGTWNLKDARCPFFTAFKQCKFLRKTVMFSERFAPRRL